MVKPTQVNPASPPQDPSRVISPEVVGTAEEAEEMVELASTAELAATEEEALTTAELAAAEEEALTMALLELISWAPHFPNPAWQPAAQ
jgi:hypothetical protein